MKYGVSYQDLATLQALNQELQSYEEPNLSGFTLPLQTSVFTLGPLQSASDIDAAIGASELYLYAQIEFKEVVEEVNKQLAEMAKPPDGYELYDNAGSYAYLKGVNGFKDLDDADINLLVDAANNLGEKTHGSSDCSGNFGDADAYTHNRGANRLFSFKRNGNHTDGYPKLTVVKQGDVNAGTHQF